MRSFSVRAAAAAPGGGGAPVPPKPTPPKVVAKPVSGGAPAAPVPPTPAKPASAGAAKPPAAAAAAPPSTKPVAAAAPAAVKPATPVTAAVSAAAAPAKPAAAAAPAPAAKPKPTPTPIATQAGFTSAAAAKTAGLDLTARPPPRKPTSLAAPVVLAPPPTPKPTRPLNLAFVSAEVAPWSKTGGLGDVVSGLPLELAKRGHKVCVIAPRYDQYADAWDTAVTADVGGGETVRFFHAIKDGVDVVFVDHPAFLAKVWGKTGAKLYGRASGADWDDNTARFALFNKAALAALDSLPFCAGQETDAIVANDWHTALLPVLVKEVHRPAGRFPNTKVALCCHNAAFQGRFWPETWGVLGLPASSRPLFEFADGVDKVFVESEGGAAPTPAAGRKFAKLNWLKAGLLTADKVLTVSENYAAELTEDASKGVELDAVWRAVGVEGIVNGMSAGEWDPATDAFLDVNFDAGSVEAGKAAAKAVLQAEVGLPVDPAAPLMGFIGRLEEQKGVDIIIAALPALLAGPGPKPQVVILGTGKADLEAAILQLDSQFPGSAVGVAEFSPRLAHLINAGADFALIPSRFEPCGIVQLQAMVAGTVPIVSSTGGLVDTVKDGVTGFHFGAVNPDRLEAADAAALAAAARRAADSYGTPAYKAMRDACIGQDLSWAQPALKWEAMIEEMLGGGGGAAAKKAGVVAPAAAL